MFPSFKIIVVVVVADSDDTYFPGRRDTIDQVRTQLLQVHIALKI